MIFRLLQYDNVVGYMRSDDGYTLYSSDMYGWNGKPIEFHAKEIDSGYRDRNNRRLFVNDMINVRYYRNPQALKITGSFRARIDLDKKQRLIVRSLKSGETRRIDFLSDTVSLEYIGRFEPAPRNN